MPDPTVFNPVMLRLSQLFALRPTLKSMGVTQVQIDQHYQDVLNGYVEKLIVFFTEPDASGVSRWRSLAQLLEQALRQARPSREDAWVRRLIRVVLYFPDSGLRDEQLPSPSPQVYLVERFGCQALAIIQGDDKALLCTLTRGIEVFDDVACMKRDTGVLLADTERLEHDVFEGWALGALEMTIQRIERVDLGLFPNLEQLDRQLAWASRFWDLFEPQVQQDKLRHELEEQLPAWLKSAPPEGRLAYSQYLERLASAHKRFKGMSVLDSVPLDRSLLRDIRTDEGEECRQWVSIQLVLHLRRLALEYALQGQNNVTFDGYRILHAATEFFMPQRQIDGVCMVFRPLEAEDGYLVGPPAGKPGLRMVIRLWSTPVMQQVLVEPAAGEPLTNPVTALYLASVERWLPMVDPSATQFGIGWARSQAMLPILEHPLQTVARLGQIGGNLQGDCEAGPAWRCEVSLLRNLALLLVCPGTQLPSENRDAHPRVKRLDSDWAGARQVLSVKQTRQLSELRRQLPAITELVTSGIHKGLHILRNGAHRQGEPLIYNKDENQFHVLSDNQININIHVHGHRLLDSTQQPIKYGPYIVADSNDQWHIQRAPRFKRDLEGLKPAARQAMDTGNTLSNTFPSLLSDADRQSRVPGALAVEAQESLERHANAFDSAARAIQSSRGDAPLASQLQAQARQLRAKGRSLRIEMTRQRPAPTVGDVEYLLAQRVIRIRKLDGRVPEIIDGKTDFLQEYEVQDCSDGNKPLWYAHFHYTSLDAADDHPTAAHLKTAAQRGLGREYELRTGQKVYRAPISNATGRAIFLGAPAI